MPTIDSMADDFTPPVDPLSLLTQWLEEARTTQLCEPWAMVLSTSFYGEVSSRVILLKKMTEQCLFFYSNYQSHKGLQLSKNPKAALNFHWDELKRQVCIRGIVKMTSREDSESYWKSRPRSSQLSQYLSQQSHPIPENLSLRQAHMDLEKRFANKTIPCPKNWGGYKLKPQRIEFWLKGENRLHQRWNYQLIKNQWTLTRLYP